MKRMGVQAMSMAVLVVATMLLVAPTTTEGSRALLSLGKLIDHFLDCPPPPAAEEAPAPAPAYSVPYYSPPDGVAPAPGAYNNVPEAPEYPSPPGPPYADSSPPVDTPSPISEPAPEYPTTPPAGGY